MTYEPVLPREHDPACRRGIHPRGSRHEPRSEAIADHRHFGLDRERCERCRNLWRRLEEAAERRHARRPAEAP